MKSTLLSVLFVLAIAMSVVQAQELVHLSPEETIVISSKELNQDRKLLIRLPRSYGKKNIKYPVIYLFDAHDKTLFNFTSSVVDRMMWTRDMPEAIIVGVIQTDRSKELNFEKQEENATKFLSFFKNEVLPYVDSHYATLGFPVLIGHSLGGQFVTHAMTVYPETFRAVISISGAFYYSSQEKFFQGKVLSELNNFLNRAPFHPGYYYFSTGDEGFQDGTFRIGALKVDSLFKAFPPKGIQWVFHDLKGYNHGSTPLISIPDGLNFIFKDWRFPENLAANIIMKGIGDPLEALKEQENRIRKNYGTEITIPSSIYYQFSDFYMQHKNYEKAKQLIDKNMELDKNMDTPYGKMGDILVLTGQLKEAKHYYKLAMDKVDPSDENRIKEYQRKIKETEAQ